MQFSHKCPLALTGGELQASHVQTPQNPRHGLVCARKARTQGARILRGGRPPRPESKDLILVLPNTNIMLITLAELTRHY